MSKFTDTIKIRVHAGKGGAGALSFYREKFIPKGGPDGGDGGKGGDVYLQADGNYHTLSHLFKDRVYRGGTGQTGMGRNKHGKDGKDLVIKIPPGTEIIDEDSGEILYDVLEDGQTVLVGQGGIGGKGNAFFKSSTRQTPRFSQPGMPGQERTVLLNLKLIADVGLVGLPNAGKSTLLSVVTNARPKIADYPFTTLIPNLGVVERKDGSPYRIADIPGIIEGAHKGLGLGLSFLRHIERVKIILYLIDATEEDPAYSLKLLKEELRTYNTALLDKPFYILLTKADLVDDTVMLEKIDFFKKENVLPVSALGGYNIPELLTVIERLLEESIVAR